VTTEPNVRRARPRDAQELAAVIRPEDEREIRLATGRSPREELSNQILRPGSTVYCVDQGGSILAVFGVSPATDRVGAPWLLASDSLFKHHLRRFVRDSEGWIERISRGFDLLENYAYVGNEQHIRWLRRVGFTLLEIVPYGVARQPFWRFRMVVRKPRTTAAPQES